MKLNLDLKDAHQGPFLAQDRVRASFEIRGPTFHKSPRISVKFVGTMVVSYPTHVNAASPGHFTTVVSGIALCLHECRDLTNLSR
jgi:hypothetical protein